MQESTKGEMVNYLTVYKDGYESSLKEVDIWDFIRIPSAQLDCNHAEDLLEKIDLVKSITNI